MSRIENRPDPKADDARASERTARANDATTGTGGDGRGPAAPQDFRGRLNRPRVEPGEQDGAPNALEARRGTGATGDELPVLDRPLPSEDPQPRSPLTVEPGAGSGSPSGLGPGPERRVGEALAKGGDDANDVAPSRRRGEAQEDGPGEVGPSAGPRAEDVPIAGPAPAPVPAAAPAPSSSPRFDPAMLQQVVEFAALTRNGDGQRELILSTNRSLLGGATLRLIALGGGKVGLRYRAGTDVHGAREGVAALARSMRDRGVQLVDVEEE